MGILIVLYWFAVAFAMIFALSTGFGLAFGFTLREALAGAFWQALIISVAGAALFAAIWFGLALMGAPTW
ncbi:MULTISPECIES: hypothetical protein [unclassified Dietzia]|uniref:hypothetical protein n=1 Tax=unclassified Dietzia TaxID=2617939 RepID=UPI0015FCE064|nr:MULTISPECIES: hypothetical protein [unclassified Dietzia]MBB1023326.1 hypothetical protein [Dietzia sp. DQ12-76]MBB1026495.1 hypothetical protein [Dietzia sp. DQ11-38-2]